MDLQAAILCVLQETPQSRLSASRLLRLTILKYRVAKFKTSGLYSRGGFCNWALRVTSLSHQNCDKQKHSVSAYDSYVVRQKIRFTYRLGHCRLGSRLLYSFWHGWVEKMTMYACSVQPPPPWTDYYSLLLLRKVWKTLRFLASLFSYLQFSQGRLFNCSLHFLAASFRNCHGERMWQNEPLKEFLWGLVKIGAKL